MSILKVLFNWPKKFFGNLYFLFFLNGFLFASLFYFKIESNYERNLFNAIQKNIDKNIDVNDSKDSVLVKIMNTCSKMLGNRLEIFAGSANDLEGVKTNIFHPATVDLMTANGACGSYALVLARILQNYHFPVRVDQMKANGHFGNHNIIEANVDGKWIVLDPLFDLFFVRPDGELASFEDVRANWTYYSRQLPKGYDTSYKYQDVRYTNWNKIPVILPVVKKILDLILGKKRADSISLRVHFLRTYEIYFYIVLFIFIPSAIVTIRKFITTKNLSGFNNLAPPSLSDETRLQEKTNTVS